MSARRLGARLVIAAMEATANWSPRSRSRLAAFIGDLFWVLARTRRRIALVNIGLCFPETKASERRRIGRHCFRNLARAFVDHGVLACAPREALERFVRVEGEAHLTDPANRPLILVAPHVAGLDAGGVRGNTLTRGVSIYARSRNTEWDRWLLAIRSRFNAPVLIARGGFNFRGAIRTLADGVPFYYLPDQDIGPRHSVFAPFFGVAAATSPIAARMAALTGAKVVTCVTEMTPEGYVLHIGPPWPDYPSSDLAVDTARMNAEIEHWVRRLPDQYLWTHRRFKTRPEGEAPSY